MSDHSFLKKEKRQAVSIRLHPRTLILLKELRKESGKGKTELLELALWEMFGNRSESIKTGLKFKKDFKLKLPKGYEVDLTKLEDLTGPSGLFPASYPGKEVDVEILKKKKSKRPKPGRY